jgi:hypothetical protein
VFYVWDVLDRTDYECRLMLEVCGYTFDPSIDAYVGSGGRVLSVDAIVAHDQYWLAKWITRTLEDSIAVAHRWGP